VTAPRTKKSPPGPDAESAAELQHFSRAQTAKLLGVSPNYLFGLVKRNEIGYTVIAGSYKFLPRHIREYSERCEVKAKRVAA
jgi:hypothetical protein